MGADPALVALALASAFCFAAGLVLARRGLRHLPPLRGACVSVPATALLLLALAPARLDLAAWHPGGAAVFALVGCLFPAAVTLLTFEANRRIGPNLTGALGNLAPLFAVLLAFLALGEVPRPGQLAAIGVIVLGVAVLFGGWEVSRALGWALALPLLAALVRGLAQPAVRHGLGLWPDPFAAALIGYLVSAALLLGIGAARGALGPAPLPGLLWFVAVGLCNGLAVLTMYAALARGPVAVVAPLVACYPVVTLLLSVPVLGRHVLTPRAAAGVALTVAGVAALLGA
ncbi:DMT family transporter [Crenalkalicoccus roseus]|uniref:DMT family transporter n=1 Tax=Crenalkalicoccus roseus TaxID=1485588 RepID=UPI001080D3F7|nr:DMT family transporter [Crenalkalicoccus roseus]